MQKEMLHRLKTTTFFLGIKNKILNIYKGHLIN